MELREWIIGQHSGLRMLLRTNILEMVPKERLAERPPEGGNSIAWLIWHTARCEDAAINTIVRGQPEVVVREGWASRLGVDEPSIGTSMGDDEVEAFSARLDTGALMGYREAVFSATHDWLKEAPLDALDAVPDVEAHLKATPGTLRPQAEWVRGIWQGRPASFFIGFTTISHGYMHLGEMMATRGRLGIRGL